VLFDPAWLDAGEADATLAALTVEVAWEQGAVRFFGESRLEPRLTAWYGDADYTYSGRTLRARPWPPLVAELRMRVEHAVGHAFNGVLLNRYRDGRDSMGFHADAEPELGRNPVVASLSLGVTRRFVLKPTRRAGAAGGMELALGHGSLLVMGGTCQHTFRHGVPREPAVVGERLNLTFRRVLR
jgi:alkylated DNA repair dioxygenase AlkB